jgi:glucokinase
VTSTLAGVDLGATKLQVVVADAEGRVLARARRPSPGDGPDAVLAAIVAAIRAALDEAGATPAELAAIGVGAPGQVDAERGVVLRAVNLPGWERPVEIAGRLTAELGAPTVVANDVQASVVGEHRHGAGRGLDNLLGVFCGTGVGGGLVLGGRLWTGEGAAGEIGHTVVRRGGARCGCGRRGCLEAYAGRMAMERRARLWHERGRRTALFAIMRELGRDRLTSRVWADALAAGDEVAADLVDRAARAVGTGAASAANLLDPQAIVIGGGLALRLGEPFLEAIRASARRTALRDDIGDRLRLSTLGDDGGALGAAMIAAGRLA